jgi:YfiH family protein
MLIISPYIFKNYEEIIFGFSTKIGLNRAAPYYFNMSFNVGDREDLVDENRREFFSFLGFDYRDISFQKQVHGDTITMVNRSGNCGESDALITNEFNLGLVISSADCPGIFIYDKEEKIIAAVHSGWRGTAKRLLEKTLIRLKRDFGSRPDNFICYICPSVSGQNYEVGREVAENFDSILAEKRNGKYYLDLRTANYKMLLNAGVKKCNIQVSRLCTFEYSNLLHSYRKEGAVSGRALGVMVMKGKT